MFGFFFVCRYTFVNIYEIETNYNFFKTEV